jgi:hypothetical protein
LSQSYVTIITQKLTNADRTENREGEITEFCNLWLGRGTQKKLQGFFVANMGPNRMVLGYPWFKEFNPQFNWSENTLLGEAITVQTASHYQCQKRKETIATANVTPATTHPMPSTEGTHNKTCSSIPPEYQRHWRVFDETLAKQFPPSREEDHKILLKPNAPTSLNCKIYPLTPMEQEATRTYICENLENRYIKESDSPYASPVFC